MLQFPVAFDLFSESSSSSSGSLLLLFYASLTLVFHCVQHEVYKVVPPDPAPRPVVHSLLDHRVEEANLGLGD